MKQKIHNLFFKIPTMFWGLGFLLLFGLFNYFGLSFKAKLDFTSDQRFTFSEGTQEILKDLKTPVTIRYYASEAENVMPIALRNYAGRIEDLFQNIAEASSGKVIFEKLDPLPNSDAELAAKLDGIKGHPIDLDLSVYLGASFTCLDQSRVIPFIDPETEDSLEYEFVKRIYEVSQVKDAKTAVLSSVPTFSRDRKKFADWAVLNEMRGDSKIVELTGKEKEIAEDVSLLIVIHPQNIAKEFTRAVEGFLRRGGRMVLLLDSVALSNKLYGVGISEENASSQWPEISEQLGFRFKPDQAILDMRLKATLDRGLGEEVLSCILDYTGEGVNRDHPVSKGINKVRIPITGHLDVFKNDNFDATVLLTSTEDSQLYPHKTLIPLDTDLSALLLKNFKADDQTYNVAALFEGKYPGGTTETRVFVAGDTDFISDPFCGQVSTEQGYPVFQPFNGNMDFFLNVVDYLKNDQRLTEIRSRPHKSFPLTRLVDLQRDADKKYNAKIRELEGRAETLVKESEEAQKQATHNTGSERFSSQAQTRVKELKELQKSLNQELRLLRLQFRADVKQIETKIKWINIAIVPVVVALLGCIVIGLRHFQSRARTEV